MKKLLLIIIVALSLQPVLNVQAKNKVQHYEKEQAVKQAKNSVKIGYFVYIEKCGEVAELKTESLEAAEIFIRSFYPYFCEYLEYEFQCTPYYQVSALQKEIYVEKMRIVKGKYKHLKTNQK